MEKPGRPSLWVTVVTRDGTRRAYELGAGVHSIGRDPSCVIALTDPKASRHHARLELLADGGTVLQDDGSTNGTWVDGERVVGRRLLPPSVELRIGATKLFVTESAETRPFAGSANRLTAVPRGRLVAAALTVLVLGGVAFSVRDPSPQDVISSSRDAVMLVTTRQDGEIFGTGTAWAVAGHEDLLVTNAHVVSGGNQISVTGTFGQLSATIIGIAPCDDLAVLRADLPSDVRGLDLASQAGLSQGDEVIALGFPGDASASSEFVSTLGTVSVVQQAFDSDSLDVPALPNVIQFTAAVNPGNSGGPLLDSRGKLVGVVTAHITEQGGRVIQGQSYAIGVDRLSQLLDQLEAGATPAWTGAHLMFLPEGVVVAGVVPGSPASRAGIQFGDLLVSVNGVSAGATLRDYCSLAGTSENVTQTFESGRSVSG